MRVHHLAFRTRDVARLARFYRDVLRLPRAPGERDDESRVWLLAGETLVMIERADEGEPRVPAGSKELVAFAIGGGEEATWRARLADSGVAVEGSTAYSLYVRDPDGRKVALSAFPEPLGRAAK